MIKKMMVSGLLMLTATAAFAADSNPHQFEKCMASALEERPGDIIKVEFKNEQGGHFYEFDIKGDDGADWDIECNAHRGLVSEVEREVDSANHPLFAAKAKITEKEARITVLSIYPGTITDVEYEIEFNGAASYEFDIDTTLKQEMKVEVDAATGDIVEANREMWQIGLE